MKKLYRSRQENMISGVLGGLGEYFQIDAVLLRIIWVFVVVFSGFFPGIVVYLACVLIIPLRPHERIL